MNSARMDLLTGLLSRPGLEDKLVQEQSKSQIMGKAFSVILADIDHIGEINSKFGMKMGDQIIIRTGSILKESVANQELVGRWSSEEFLILLPETTLEEAKALAEKIRSRIEKESLNFNQNQISLTLSMGVNHCLPDMEWDKCIAEAQECMHQAKALGRNRLVAIDMD
jgi:diguanylate cyclase (GGDEF)-like protein